MKGLVPFNQAGFEAGILLAMGLGIPDDPDLQPTFVFPGTTTASVPVDDEGVPFDPAAKVSRTPGKPDVRVRCAVEMLDRQGTVLDFAIAQADQARLTLLDAQYRQVQGFDHVLLGGTPYDYRETFPPIALGPSVVWQVLVATRDES